MKLKRLYILKKRLLKKMSLMTSVLMLPSLASAETKSISYENHTNFTSESDDNNTSNSIQFSLRLEEATRTLDYYGEADIRYRFENEGSQSFSVPELYVKLTNIAANGTRSEAYAGRKILDWNQHQGYWLQNDFNPMQNFSLLGKKQEGLFGVFGDHKTKHFEISGFVSILNVPELEPQVDVENGEIKSNTYWAKLPPKKARIKDQDYPVYYKLEDIDYMDLINKKSLGTQIVVKPDSTWRLSAHAIYKPENFVRPNADASLSVIESEDRVEVEINPIINHHAIYGGGIEKKINNFKISLAYEHINPLANLGSDFDYVLPSDKQDARDFEAENYKIAPDYTKREYFYSSLSFEKPYLLMSLNYTKKTKGQSPEDDLGNGVSDKWLNAIGYLMSYRFNDKTSFSFDVKYDFERKDNILSGEFAHRFFKDLEVALGVELVDGESKDSYWNDYINQDTVYSSLGYFF